MKIGFVVDDELSKPDGVQQYIKTLGARYTRMGHEVHYLVGETKEIDIPNVYSLAKNVKVRFNGNALTIPLPTGRKRIKEILAAEQFDVLHVQTPYSPFFAAQVVFCASKSTAIVSTFHILPFGRISWIGTRLLGMCLWRSLRRFDAFVSVSRPAAVFARQTFKIDSQIIPNSIEIEMFKPQKPVVRSGGLSIMFLGRLVHRKGCLNLLQALAILQKDGRLPKDTTITICGAGALRSDLEQFAQDNDLADQVIFMGFVTDDEKVDCMQKADIAVFPSLSGESFGVVLIEAMAAESGVVLGGDNPGYRSVLEDMPESIVSAHKPAIFAEELASYIQDEQKRAELHAKQQQYVGQFDTPVVAKQLLQLYATCKTTKTSR